MFFQLFIWEAISWSTCLNLEYFYGWKASPRSGCFTQTPEKSLMAGVLWQLLVQRGGSASSQGSMEKIPLSHFLYPKLWDLLKDWFVLWVSECLFACLMVLWRSPNLGVFVLCCCSQSLPTFHRQAAFQIVAWGHLIPQSRNSLGFFGFFFCFSILNTLKSA